MKNKWNLFLAAAFFGGWALISNGVPLAPVVAGIAGVAAINFFKQRSSSAVK